MVASNLPPPLAQSTATGSSILSSSLRHATASSAAQVSALAINNEQDIQSASLVTFLWRLISLLIWLVPMMLYWLVTFSTITLPTWLFTVGSTSLTFTLNFTTIVLIALAFASTVSWFVRYRFLNLYSRLPPEPQRKEPQIDFFPDTQAGDSKPGLANYLDEFLSAIKVFGYLERPVFHELTRTMQTRKLIAGETLLLEEEKGFCLVVDGVVQIFAKSTRESKSEPDGHWLRGNRDAYEEEEEEHQEEANQGYQLLTEVKNGAPMSSLFSVLSLFTEDVKLRHDDRDSGESGSSMRHTPTSGVNSPPEFPASPGRPELGRHGSSHLTESGSHEYLTHVPPLRLETAEFEEARPRSHHGRPTSRPNAKESKSIHPDIVARAVVDTTIAIIPASAFRRLTRVYPKATSHIVQVILTRLQRVTLETAHTYLGLTTDVIRVQKLMNKYTTYDLPNHLRGSALDRLKDKFRRERERIGAEDITKGIALHHAMPTRRRRTSSVFRGDAATQKTLSQNRSRADYSSSLGDRETNGVSPGDLLSNIQLSRSGGRHPHPTLHGGLARNSVESTEFERRDVTSPLSKGEHEPFMPSSPQAPHFHRQDSADEDSIFRESIVQCFAKAIGLTGNTQDALKKPTGSVEQSPRLLSYDSRRQKAVFSNAFGYIDPYETSEAGESESVMSSSFGSLHGIQNIAEDLRDDIEIVYFPKGAVLVEQGERNPGLYYVIDGFLDVSIPVDEKGSAYGEVFPIPNSGNQGYEDLLAPLQRTATVETQSSSVRDVSRTGRRRGKQSRKSLFLVKPGGIAGYVGTISSYRSFIDVRAKTDVYVGFLPRATLERLVEKFPIVLLTMAKRLTSLLPRLLLHIDFALEWVQVNAGQVIYHQRDDSDAIYIVLNGRLRAIQEKDDRTMRVSGEYGQGESVGELEVMTESSRPATLHAIRDTELAKFPKSLFNGLSLEHPGITMQISKLIAQRMRALIDDPMADQRQEKGAGASERLVNSSLNLRTVAVLPVTTGVPVVEFGGRLLTALAQIGVANGATSLNQAAVLNHLGRHAFSSMGKLKLSQYLADLEEKYGMVLYVADTNVNAPWTQTCISQADCILLVGLAEGSPSIGEYERFLLGMKTTARKELVLLHVERYCPPGLTRKWLRNRVWINGGHHHIQMAFRTTSEPAHPQARRFGSALKQRVQVLQAEIQKYTSRRVRQTPLYSAETPFKGDFHRLARRLCGKSVGLVLGGGGARGISQIGVIRALEEAGIPIDIVGGTSIGAFIGALYARDADVVPMYGRAKKFAGRMGSIWRFALDLTYPSASYTTGHEFNRGIFKTFGNSQIEDFWLEFYCNTTNISKSRSEIHSSGYVWRYVRASMSLAGLIPPLCDEGHMLLDGGYVDNLTVAHMKSLGADVIFAIDVGSLDDNTPQQFGDSLSGFWAFFNRWNPFSPYPNPPTLSEIQARLAYVSSIGALERAKTMPGCLYMRPPIDPYGTLEFAKFEDLYNLGYEYGKDYLGQLRDKGVLPITEETEEKRAQRRTMAPRRASI